MQNENFKVQIGLAFFFAFAFCILHFAMPSSFS